MLELAPRFSGAHVGSRPLESAPSSFVFTLLTQGCMHNWRSGAFQGLECVRRWTSIRQISLVFVHNSGVLQLVCVVVGSAPPHGTAEARKVFFGQSGLISFCKLLEWTVTHTAGRVAAHKAVCAGLLRRVSFLGVGGGCGLRLSSQLSSVSGCFLRGCLHSGRQPDPA